MLTNTRPAIAATLALLATSAAPAAAQFEQNVAPGDLGYLWIGPKTGLWNASLEAPGGPIRFKIDIQHTGQNNYEAAIVNGQERIPVSLVADAETETFLFEFPHYDSSIRGTTTIAGNNLRGSFYITKGPDLQRVVPFLASLDRLTSHEDQDDQAQQPAPEPNEPEEETPSEADILISALQNPLPTTWAIDFADQDTPSVGRFFTMPDGVNVEGTILNATGDYRYLNGTWDGSALTLSTFDGAHAFLFKAELQNDGSMTGDFWSGNHYHTTWTATEDPSASVPDAMTATSFDPTPDWSALSFPDLDGNPVSLASYIGQPLVIGIMGSWCPNCHDAARVLADLKAEYADDGLQVLAIAFEYTGNFERDVAQVRRYLERHDLDTDTLIGGTNNKADATDSLGFLDEVRAYPTTIFVDPNGRITAVHTGFSGPATGDDYQDTIEAFRTQAQRITNTP